ncbi:lysine transporter LysE [Nonlabens spongiae]|uniref:Lysine transporter LysE n=1 Tax=Nonlabens spongiae TaxID=331648 RepID=A0A1W6MGP5_9FLAO|nr:LysE family translocator [Nonlabens spongiae]ARN76649.1 lysine transporter LysE [Nonlabens spongiae]
MDFQNLLTFSLFTLGLALSPGPDNIFVLTQSMARGARTGIAISSGLITGCIFHTTLVALGFAVVIRDNEWLLWTIKLLGAGYLLFLAYQVYRSDASIDLQAETEADKSLWEFYRIGVVMNVLNPKVTLFFLAVLTGFVQPNQKPAEWIQIFVLGGIFMAVSLFVFYAISFLAGKVSRFIKTARGFSSVMKWLQILVFLAIVAMLLFF